MIVFQVFLPFGVGYFLSYLLRAVNAVIAPDLIREMGLTAADLGLLTSANFFAFAAFQLPLGIFLDRYGPRKTESALLLVAALGALLFGRASDLPDLILGRALIGLGTSACLMAALKAYAHWAPSDRLPLVTGFHMAFGGMGALTATKPVEMALAYTDWRGLFLILTGVVLAAAAFIFLAVPRRDRTVSTETWGEMVDGIRQVFVSPAFHRLAPAAVVVQSGYIGIQSLWSGPWLRDVAGMSQDRMATHLLFIAACMVAGFLSMGTLADRLARLGIRPISVGMTGMTLFTLNLTLIGILPPHISVVLWLLFGFLGTFGILPYSVVSQIFPSALTGRAISGLNLLVFFGAFAAQWGIGAIINLWPQPSPGHFAPAGYHTAFLIVAGIQAAGLLWYALYNKVKI